MMLRSLFVFILAIVLNATANILMKVGMKQVGKVNGAVELIKKAAVQPAFWGGVVSFGLALVAYNMVLTRLNLSVAYPIMVSMGLIIVVLISYFVLNESISLIQVVGFVMIIAGVWMVAR